MRDKKIENPYNINVSFRLLDAEGDGVSSPVVVNGKAVRGSKGEEAASDFSWSPGDTQEVRGCFLTRVFIDSVV